MKKPLALKPPQAKLLTSRDKYENSFWMEQLPAHVWVQNDENSVVYSNRFPVNQQPVPGESHCRIKKISCCREFMGKKNSCPCCPYQRVTTTLQPERCVCRRGKEIYQVYHFPFAPPGGYRGNGPPYVLKIEINFGALIGAGKKAGRDQPAKAAGDAKHPQGARLIKICSACKKVQDESGAWCLLENYFHARHGIKFSHGLCGECACRLYPGIWEGPI